MQENLFISNFRLFLRIFIFIICLVPIFYYYGEKYEQASTHNVINAFTQKRFEDFYAQKKDSLDMVFIGSSHSYCTFDPENFDAVFQTKSFQMGTPLQHPDTSYFTLLEILKYQKPKVVVQEIYWDVLDDTFEMKQANSFFEVLKNEELKKQYIKEVFPLGEKLKYSFLPIRFQQDYFAYESNEIEKKIEKKYDVKKKKAESQTGEEYYRSKGYVYCNMNMLSGEYNETNQFKNFDGKDWSMDNTQKKYLKKIIELCKENNIELIFVTAPVANVSMEFIKNYDAVHETIADFAKKSEIAYIDYNIVNQNIKLFTNDNFRDDAHLNDSGVKIVNTHFIEWLKENSAFFKNKI